MATASTFACSRHATQEVDAAFSRPVSRNASPQLDRTVRYPPPDPLHLFSSGGARDATSLTPISRQIAASRAPHSAPSSQSSSFVALRSSQAGSTAELAGRAAPRAHRPLPSPSRTHSSRSSDRAEHAGEVLLQMFAQFSGQVTAQLVAHSTALSSVMQRFETLHPPTPPSRSRRPERQQIPASRSPIRRTSPSSQRSPYRQSALDADALQGVTLPFPARPLALDPRSTAHQLTLYARIASPVPLGAAQQSHQLAPSPHAPKPRASHAPSALLELSPNPAESPQSEHLLAPLALPSLSFASLPSHLQYVLQYSQSATRVASTVVVPAALQPGTTSALYKTAPIQFESVALQPASYAVAPLSMGAHPSQVGAQFAGAHPSHAGAPLSMGAHPLQAGAPLSMGAQPVQAEAHYVAGAHRVKTINKPVRVQRELRTRNRMRRPLSRTSRHRTRILKIQPARPLSKQRVLPNRARSRVISVARVAMSPPRAARTLALQASATRVVALATWRVSARLVLRRTP